MLGFCIIQLLIIEGVVLGGLLLHRRVVIGLVVLVERHVQGKCPQWDRSGFRDRHGLHQLAGPRDGLLLLRSLVSLQSAYEEDEPKSDHVNSSKQSMVPNPPPWPNPTRLPNNRRRALPNRPKQQRSTIPIHPRHHNARQNHNPTAMATSHRYPYSARLRLLGAARWETELFDAEDYGCGL